MFIPFMRDLSFSASFLMVLLSWAGGQIAVLRAQEPSTEQVQFHGELPVMKGREGQEILKYPGDVMRYVDGDRNDQTLTLAEYRAWRIQALKASFKALDKDGSKTLSEDEFMADLEEDVDHVSGSYMNEGKKPMTPVQMERYVGTKEADYLKEKTRPWTDHYPVLEDLKIRQTLLQDGDEDTPARFSYTRDVAASENFYAIDGAISYKFRLSPYMNLSPTVEAHVASEIDTTKNRDSLTYALPLNWMSKLKDDFITQHHVSLIGSYNTDGEQDTETVDASLLYTLNIPTWGIGASKEKDKYPMLIMRPWIGMEYGNVNKTGGVPDLAAESQYLRVRTDLETSLMLTEFFSLTGRYVHYTFLTGLERSYHFGEVSAVMYLDNAQAFSLGATYSRGDSAPKFNTVDTITIWAGIKF